MALLSCRSGGPHWDKQIAMKGKPVKPACDKHQRRLMRLDFARATVLFLRLTSATLWFTVRNYSIVIDVTGLALVAGSSCISLFSSRMPRLSLRLIALSWQ